jgi:hypothetical protein
MVEPRCCVVWRRGDAGGDGRTALLSGQVRGAVLRRDEAAGRCAVDSVAGCAGICVRVVSLDHDTSASRGRERLSRNQHGSLTRCFYATAVTARSVAGVPTLTAGRRSTRRQATPAQRRAASFARPRTPDPAAVSNRRAAVALAGLLVAMALPAAFGTIALLVKQPSGWLLGFLLGATVTVGLLAVLVYILARNADRPGVEGHRHESPGRRHHAIRVDG